jgi:hypothetical protein
LLYTTEKSITEICTECGFETASYFAKMFNVSNKKYIGGRNATLRSSACSHGIQLIGWFRENKGAYFECEGNGHG